MTRPVPGHQSAPARRRRSISRRCPDDGRSRFRPVGHGGPGGASSWRRRAPRPRGRVDDVGVQDGRERTIGEANGRTPVTNSAKSSTQSTIETVVCRSRGGREVDRKEPRVGMCSPDTRRRSERDSRTHFACTTRVGTETVGSTTRTSMSSSISSAHTDRGNAHAISAAASRSRFSSVTSSGGEDGRQAKAAAPELRMRRPTRPVLRSRLPRAGRRCALNVANAPYNVSECTRLGERRREQDRHRTALGKAHRRGPLRPDGVHHRPHIVHAILEAREYRSTGRSTRCRSCRT